MTIPTDKMLADAARVENAEIPRRLESLVSDLCCHVRTLVAENERLRETIRKQKQDDDDFWKYPHLRMGDGT